MIGLLVLPVRSVAQGLEEGIFVTVPLNIGDVERIRDKINDVVEKKRRKVKTVLFDFNPNGQTNSSGDFGTCYNLAKLINDLQLGRLHGTSYSVVAFLRGGIGQHTNLPVLACGQIVASDEFDSLETRASRVFLGDMNKAGPLTAPEKSAYHELVRYPRDLDALLAGQRFDLEQLRKRGIVKEIANSPRALVGLLQLSPKTLQEDWLVGRTVIAHRIDVHGPLDAAKAASIERRMKAAVRRGANLLIFHLDSERGETRDMASLAHNIQQLRDEANRLPMRTVAFVPAKVSLGAATFIALGCNEIFMAPDSALADFSYFTDKNDKEAVRLMLLESVKKQGYPPLLFEAAFDPSVEVYRVEDAGVLRLVSRSEMEQRGTKGKRVDLNGRISASLAEESQIATILDSIDALIQREVGRDADVKVSRDDWLDQAAEFFREPWVNFLLVVLGVLGLFLEFKLPGTTIPGIVGTLCFVLFFWSYSFVGQWPLLAVLLFILGLALIAIEILLIPGFTFTGLMGFGLVLFSMVLVTLEKMPGTSEEWRSLGSTLGTFVISMVVAGVAAFSAMYYLPHIPYASRLVLQPPNTEEDAGMDPPKHQHLLGALGVTLTPLRPSGKAQFGDEFLDVVAEGEYVKEGREIRVIEVDGNRLVVKEL